MHKRENRKPYVFRQGVPSFEDFEQFRAEGRGVCPFPCPYIDESPGFIGFLRGFESPPLRQPKQWSDFEEWECGGSGGEAGAAGVDKPAFAGGGMGRGDMSEPDSPSDSGAE